MKSYKEVLKIGKCAHEWLTPAWVTVECSPFKLQLHVHYLNTWGFPGGSDSTEPACKAGDPGLIPGQEDPLEKGMATHSSILAWTVNGGHKESDTTWAIYIHKANVEKEMLTFIDTGSGKSTQVLITSLLYFSINLEDYAVC